ncbi:MAG: 4Fe-4S binding protein [Spirochaetia bacterium]|nr:4Fe-4S binding protein [Spirochaetia bacterium]
MLRDMIEIDGDKCNGCGVCVQGCPEGALQVIDGKVRLVSDLLCDGLGACINECPQGALKAGKKEAQSYDEKIVMANIVKAGGNTIKAHLKHLDSRGETKHMNEALQYLKTNGIEAPDYRDEKMHDRAHGGGCPGSGIVDFSEDEGKTTNNTGNTGTQPSQLSQWPIQLHLVSPSATYYRDKDLLLAADCVAFSMGNFHRDHLKGKGLAIACPKLDSEQEIYAEKITAMIDEAKVNTITAMIMQVPCCGGLLATAKRAAAAATRKVPIKAVTVGLKGDVLSEEWV